MSNASYDVLYDNKQYIFTSIKLAKTKDFKLDVVDHRFTLKLNIIMPYYLK